jgi:hypothetical protein
VGLAQPSTRRSLPSNPFAISPGPAGAAFLLVKICAARLRPGGIDQSTLPLACRRASPNEECITPNHNYSGNLSSYGNKYLVNHDQLLSAARYTHGRSNTIGGNVYLLLFAATSEYARSSPDAETFLRGFQWDKGGLHKRDRRRSTGYRSPDRRLPEAVSGCSRRWLRHKRYPEIELGATNARFLASALGRGLINDPGDRSSTLNGHSGGTSRHSRPIR